MPVKKIILPLLFMGMFLFSACGMAAGNSEKIDYQGEMANLVGEIHDYSKAKNPNFGLITNGGVVLYTTFDDNKPESAAKMLNSVSGALTEAVFYGTDMDNDALTAKESQDFYFACLEAVQQKNIPVFNVDYCASDKTVADAYKRDAEKGYIGFATKNRLLSTIPAEVHAENNNAVNNLGAAKNILLLLNPGEFSGKENYLNAIKNTNYDVVIVDLFYGGVPLTKDEVASLQQKANGARRQVYAYMSTGEAEDYRWYWQEGWKANPPAWLEKANDDWAGNYKVKYWQKEWKNILYGNADAYLDKIIAAGFDGAFLDVIDAYQYFMEKENEAN